MTLAELRKRNNLTQCEVAELLDTTQSAVCQWEKGTKFVTRKKIAKLVEVYHCTYDELFACFKETYNAEN